MPFSKGLIVVSESGFFGIWMKNEDPTNMTTEEDHKLIYLRGWSSDRFYSACSLDIYQDNLLAASFKNNDIATFDLNKILPNSMTENAEMYRRNNKLMEKKHKFDFVYTGYHLGNLYFVIFRSRFIIRCLFPETSHRNLFIGR